MYDSTRIPSGSVTGGEPFWHSILCNWLIPDRNTDQHIGIAVLLRGICVDFTKGLECGSNGSIILGGASCEDALVPFWGLLGLLLAYSGVVPTAV